MRRKRRISARAVVTDLRAGITDHDLMEKYSLSSKGLQSLFRKLVAANWVEPSELKNRVPSLEDSVDLSPGRLARCYPLARVPIYDLDDLGVTYYASDLHERGVKVERMKAEVGETKDFLLNAAEFSDAHPFRFSAVCRWSKPATGSQPCFSGFEITQISEDDTQQLRSFLEHASIRDFIP